MAQTVIGFFNDSLSAYKAVANLTTRGIVSSQIDITREEKGEGTAIAHEGESGNGFTRFFKNLFGDNDEADRYSTISRQGYTMVTVHARSAEEASFAAGLLDDAGALDVDETATPHADADRTQPQTDLHGEDHREASIQRIEEDIHISKQREDRGGKRVRSRIVEKPVEENIRLREERIRVERNPVDRVASEKDLLSFQEGDIELTERKEVPVVNKEARVVEEIRVHKDVEEREATVHESIKHTEVDINNIDQQEDYNNNTQQDKRHLDGNRNYLNNESDDDRYNPNYRQGSRDGDPLFGV